MNILCLTCQDKPGIVAAVAGCLSDNGCNIEESSQFNDPASNNFYMRVVYSAADSKSYQNFTICFTGMAEQFSMEWTICDQSQPVKAALLVSQHDHCLHHLLYQWKAGHLPIEPTCIISNHETAKPLADHYALDFHYLPVNKDNKEQQEADITKIIENTNSELVVLARYMQILSEDMASHYHGRIINIHHSFLPGFKGARPYHQAYERGVKIIGATAHFATADLDEGPIITQTVVPVDHTHTPDIMQAMGRDNESLALARAIQLYAQRRVFITQNKTIIL